MSYDPPINIIFKTKFGSHLYGTQNEKSDTDYKGVFLPTINDLLCGKLKKSVKLDTKKGTEKNTSEDVDCEIYSLHYFLDLAIAGETVALDMLHTPLPFAEISTPAWARIHVARKKFYTKNMKSYLGYCRRQASKYGIKGSRLADAKKVLNYLKTCDENKRISDCVDKFPEGEHIYERTMEDSKSKEKRAFEICNRLVPFDCRVKYAIEMVTNFYDSYGERARKAEANEGIDWKAVSHAFRAGYQLKEIFESGDLKYPLKKAGFLREIKEGKYHYKDDNISLKLENLIDKIEILADKSRYPLTPQKGLKTEIIMREYHNKIMN